MKLADNINILGEFCGKRDVQELTVNALQKKYGYKQADVMVLFGGSIICGGDVLADAIKQKIAKKYIIVGGEGHTTEKLRVLVHREYAHIETNKASEAEIFSAYIFKKYGLKADYLECKSTNCGNNITLMLEMLNKNNITFKSIILAQDATMQNRMEAVLRKYVSKDVSIINFATYKAEVVEKNGQLNFKEDIYGMWDMNQYISLILGEIQRLTDNEEGYGPKGKNFIAHVDVPEEVIKAFSLVKENYAHLIRKANPLYATVK